MNTSPLISVIIPCHNEEKYIPETINSVLDQSYGNVEIIVIDDGSTDDTGHILKLYKEHIKLIKTKNKGASQARNIGIAESNGEYIQFLDSDDILESDALQKRLKVLLDSDAEIAYSDWQELKERENGTFQKGKLHTQYIEDIDNDPSIALFTKFWSPPAAYFFKKDTVIKVGGFNEDLTFGEDARFVFDAAEKGAKFKKVDGVGAYYRIKKAGNLSKSDPHGFLADIYQNTCDVDALWRSNGELSSKQKQALILNYDYTARNLFYLDCQLFKNNLISLYTLQPGFKLTWPKVAGLLSGLVGYKMASFFMKSLFPLKK